MTGELIGRSHGAAGVDDGAVIEVRGLRMRYGSADVLKGVDFAAG